MSRIGRRIDEKLIESVGRLVLWEKASLLTARRYDGSVPFFAQEDENNRGYNYTEPTQIKVLLTSDGRTKQFDPAGAWEQGSAMMTFFASLDVGVQDRITFLDMPVRQELTLVRGAGSQDALPTGLTIKSVLLLRDNQSYSLEADYQLTKADDAVTHIDWSPGQAAPSVGQTYIALCNVLPQWIVAEQPMVRSFGPRQLPKRASLKRYDQRLKS